MLNIGEILSCCHVIHPSLCIHDDWDQDGTPMNGEISEPELDDDGSAQKSLPAAVELHCLWVDVW